MALGESKREIYREWVKEMIREEFGEAGCSEGAALAEAGTFRSLSGVSR